MASSNLRYREETDFLNQHSDRSKGSLSGQGSMNEGTGDVPMDRKSISSCGATGVTQSEQERRLKNRQEEKQDMIVYDKNTDKNSSNTNINRLDIYYEFLSRLKRFEKQRTRPMNTSKSFLNHNDNSFSVADRGNEDVGVIPTAAVSKVLHDMGYSTNSDSIFSECFTYLQPLSAQPNHLTLIPLEKWLNHISSSDKNSSKDRDLPTPVNSVHNVIGHQSSIPSKIESSIGGSGYNSFIHRAPAAAGGPGPQSLTNNRQQCVPKTPDSEVGSFAGTVSTSMTTSATLLRRQYEMWTEGRLSTDQFLDELRDNGLTVNSIVEEKLRQADFTRGLTFAQVRRLTLTNDRETENQTLKYQTGPKKHRQCFQSDNTGYDQRNSASSMKNPVYAWQEGANNNDMSISQQNEDSCVSGSYYDADFSQPAGVSGAAQSSRRGQATSGAGRRNNNISTISNTLNQNQQQVGGGSGGPQKSNKNNNFTTSSASAYCTKNIQEFENNEVPLFGSRVVREKTGLRTFPDRQMHVETRADNDQYDESYAGHDNRIRGQQVGPDGQENLLPSRKVFDGKRQLQSPRDDDDPRRVYFTDRIDDHRVKMHFPNQHNQQTFQERKIFGDCHMNRTELLDKSITSGRPGGHSGFSTSPGRPGGHGGERLRRSVELPEEGTSYGIQSNTRNNNNYQYHNANKQSEIEYDPVNSAKNHKRHPADMSSVELPTGKVYSPGANMYDNVWMPQSREVDYNPDEVLKAKMKYSGIMHRQSQQSSGAEEADSAQRVERATPIGQSKRNGSTVFDAELNNDSNLNDRFSNNNNQKNGIRATNTGSYSNTNDLKEPSDIFAEAKRRNMSCSMSVFDSLDTKKAMENNNFNPYLSTSMMEQKKIEARKRTQEFLDEGPAGQSILMQEKSSITGNIRGSMRSGEVNESSDTNNIGGGGPGGPGCVVKKDLFKSSVMLHDDLYGGNENVYSNKSSHGPGGGRGSNNINNNVMSSQTKEFNHGEKKHKRLDHLATDLGFGDKPDYNSRNDYSTQRMANGHYNATSNPNLIYEDPNRIEKKTGRARADKQFYFYEEPNDGGHDIRQDESDVINNYSDHCHNDRLHDDNSNQYNRNSSTKFDHTSDHVQSGSNHTNSAHDDIIVDLVRGWASNCSCRSEFDRRFDKFVYDDIEAHARPSYSANDNTGSGSSSQGAGNSITLVYPQDIQNSLQFHRFTGPSEADAYRDTCRLFDYVTGKSHSPAEIGDLQKLLLSAVKQIDNYPNQNLNYDSYNHDTTRPDLYPSDNHTQSHGRGYHHESRY